MATHTKKVSHPLNAEIPGAQALVRGLDVLMAVGNSSGALRFVELQAELGIPKGSLHRVLAALQSRQLVRYDRYAKVYTLGSKVMDLARRTIDQSSLIKHCKPELLRLSRQLRRGICLYLLDEDEVFVLDYENPDASQARVVNVWPRLAVTLSAPGIAILSHLDDYNREQLPLENEQLDDSTIGLSKALGYSIWSEDDFFSIASAIVDDSGYPVAAICCHFGMHDGKPEDLHFVGRILSDSSTRISGNMGETVKQSYIVTERPKPSKNIKVLQDLGRDFMGENPFWCSLTKKLFWLDILAPALRWYDPSINESGRIDLPDIFGGLALTKDQRIILAGRTGIYELDRRTHKTKLLISPESNKPNNRFNTMSVDNNGAIWAGTMPIDNKNGSGSFYQVDKSLRPSTKIRNVHSPKNIAWSPDFSEAYLTEGKQSILYAYNSASMSKNSRRIIVQGSDEIGMPNGITVDSEGAIWVAMLGGWSIRRYWPDGTLDRIINLPIPMPTNLIFGDDDLQTLYITSTYLRVPAGVLTDAPLSGSIIKIRTDIQGCPINYFGNKELSI